MICQKFIKIFFYFNKTIDLRFCLLNLNEIISKLKKETKKHYKTIATQNQECHKCQFSILLGIPVLFTFIYYLFYFISIFIIRLAGKRRRRCTKGKKLPQAASKIPKYYCPVEVFTCLFNCIEILLKFKTDC